MRCLRICNSAPALLAAAVTLAACSTSPAYEKRLEQAIEAPAPLPAYPQFDRLVPVDLGGEFHYFIDPASVSVAARAVIRYTVVARSASGATNVSFEALRCQTLEHRRYAVGREDRTWSRVQVSKWESASGSTGTYYSRLVDYFCRDGSPLDAAQALRALRLGRGSDAPLTSW